MKKLLSVLLSVLMILAICVPFASAADSKTMSLKVLNYNVAGLPNPSKLNTVINNQKEIGKYIQKSDYDLVGVQEDFNLHYVLEGQISAFPYMTYTSGGVPYGDGLNWFSKYPIYNLQRIPWDLTSGIYSGGSDELTPKGFTYCTMKIADGAYIDIYDAHADAYEDEGSIAARESNFNQLAAYIAEHSEGRAVICLGDFNTRVVCACTNDIYETMLKPLGLKDAWTEIKNGGNYDVALTPDPGWPTYWGEFDSAEHIFYRSSDTVDLTAVSHDYISIGDYSDHASEAVEFNVTINGAEDGAKLTEISHDFAGYIQRMIKYFFKTLSLCLSHISEISELKNS